MNVNNVTKGFIPEIYDATIYRTLEDNLVMKKIFTAPVDKEAKKHGDTVYFSDLADPTITNYTGTLTAEDLQDSTKALLVDKTKTFCFKVQDVDKLMANAELQGSQTQRAAYNLARAIDVDAFGNVGSDANAGTALTATVNSANILSELAEIARQLMENNVSEDNMWIVLPPWAKNALKIAGVSFSINEGLNSKGGMSWTKDLGFNVYVTNTVPNSGTQASPVSTILGGSYQSVAFHDLMMTTRTNELHTSRAVQIDGGCVYGYKVIKPKELSKATWTYTAETTI